MKEATTKQKILDAARQLFVSHGFAGTSMGQIAKIAQVNHSLLFHHFGNKEKLWVAVKQSIAQDAEQQSKILPETKLPFKKFLQELITKSFSFYQKNPDIVRMINWQRLETNAEYSIGVTLSPEMQSWLDAFKYYQSKGEIDKHLKPEFIATLILSIVSSSALDKYIFIQDEDQKKKYINFCVDFLLRGVKV